MGVSSRVLRFFFFFDIDFVRAGCWCTTPPLFELSNHTEGAPRDYAHTRKRVLEQALDWVHRARTRVLFHSSSSAY